MDKDAMHRLGTVVFHKFESERSMNAQGEMVEGMSPEIIKDQIRQSFFMELMTVTTGDANKTKEWLHRPQVVFHLTCGLCGQGVSTEDDYPSDAATHGGAKMTTEFKDVLTYEEYNRDLAFMSEKMVNFFYECPKIREHLQTTTHTALFFKTVAPLQSVLGPVRNPGCVARHSSPTLLGNVPYGEVIPLAGGGRAFCRVQTGEGCPLPTRQGILQSIGDPRGMIVLMHHAVSSNNVGINDGGSYTDLDHTKVKGYALRWFAGRLMRSPPVHRSD
jgi:hypothetical protein